ncbi:hypothetical protein BCR34DRAFT_607598 [Clohesyomyces aquaticus]|uniref:Uncharacterized protein n=1 Tax=Clohesyomyces aquaticus TaxID=1231657 RepID=A0A1Y1YES1_9PLEO|nr:hypothetical protein BCR34DRAFT_607598 [Clohesyomyces aquaticus]
MQPSVFTLLALFFVLVNAETLTPTPTTDDPAALELLKRVAQAPIPSCTWEGHCLGDPCTQDGDCDHGWVCVGSVCALDSGGETALPTSARYTAVPTATFVSFISYVITASALPASTVVSYVRPSTASKGGSSALESGASSVPSSAASSTSPNHGLSTGAIIGIGAGAGVAGLAAITALFWLALRRRQVRKAAGISNEYTGPQTGEFAGHQPGAEYYNEPYKYQMVANNGIGYGPGLTTGGGYEQSEAAELVGDPSIQRPVELPVKTLR